ncbi:Glutamyl-tRNA(Gln) amidotransferase subunit F, mitochondrial [Balamuthia mandrillaris]
MQKEAVRGLSLWSKGPSWSVRSFFRAAPIGGSEAQLVEPQVLSRIAARAQLRLPSDESRQTALCHDLQQIVQCVNLIQEVDTTGVEPLVSPLQARGITLRTRPDQQQQQPPNESSSTLQTEALLNNAPVRNGSFFSVPKKEDS